jgi:hypothetical protein
MPSFTNTVDKYLRARRASLREASRRAAVSGVPEMPAACRRDSGMLQVFEFERFPLKSGEST